MQDRTCLLGTTFPQMLHSSPRRCKPGQRQRVVRTVISEGQRGRQQDPDLSRSREANGKGIASSSSCFSISCLRILGRRCYRPRSIGPHPPRQDGPFRQLRCHSSDQGRRENRQALPPSICAGRFHQTHLPILRFRFKPQSTVLDFVGEGSSQRSRETDGKICTQPCPCIFDENSIVSETKRVPNPY